MSLLMDYGERKQQFLNKTTSSILYTLRHVETARFSELMHPTGLTSDMFKFYLRDLVRAGWVEKLTGGGYKLTTAGKDIANSIDRERKTLHKQPKLSILMVVQRPGTALRPEFLFQQRQRHPYYGFWGVPSAPVRWGESIEEVATREIAKQTGIRAKFNVRSFCRVYDRGTQGALLEDKLFAIAYASDVQGVLKPDWPGGVTIWMSLRELYEKDNHFPLTRKTFELLERGIPYESFEAQFATTDY